MDKKNVFLKINIDKEVFPLRFFDSFYCIV